MSIIVYGPQGCGKTSAAALIKRAFGLHTTWDAGNYTDVAERPLYSKHAPRCAQQRFPAISEGGLYQWVRQHTLEFKSARILFITCEQPPHDLRNTRRVVAFEDALEMAVIMGIRTYLADWPRGQAIQAITARSLLEAVGVSAHLHTKPLFNAVNRLMSELRWTRVRLRAPGEPVTWAYRPAQEKEASHV